MPDSSCEPLSDNGVARLVRRRRELNLTKQELGARVEQALRARGVCQSSRAARMRLDRVFLPKMRRPISELTKMVLATALEWTLDELEEALKGSDAGKVPK